MIESPCTKVCVMDTDSGYCLGCKRTLNEIAHWGEMSDDERAAVLAQLNVRKVEKTESQEPADQQRGATPV